MAELGEITTGRERGLKSADTKYIWAACEICGKQRWVILRHGKAGIALCINCSQAEQVKRNGGSFQGRHHTPEARRRIGEAHKGVKNQNWRGGVIERWGYVYILLQPDDFFYPMANARNYVAEHRLIVAKQMHRCLLPWEVVHHINGIRTDNRLENLKLLKCRVDHLPSMSVQRQLRTQGDEIERLKARVLLLEAEITILRAQLLFNNAPEEGRVNDG